MQRRTISGERVGCSGLSVEWPLTTTLSAEMLEVSLENNDLVLHVEEMNAQIMKIDGWNALNDSLRRDLDEAMLEHVRMTERINNIDEHHSSDYGTENGSQQWCGC